MGDTLRDLRGVPFVRVEVGLLRDPRVSGELVALYSLLISFGPERIFPRQELLAQHRGVSRKAISEQLKRLRALGLITWRRRGSKSCEYDILGHQQMVATMGQADTVTPAEEAMSPHGYIAAGNVTPGPQQLSPQGYNRCTPRVARSRSKIQIHDPDPHDSGVPDADLTAIWQNTLADLLLQNKAIYGAWLQPSSLSREDGHYEVAVRDLEAQEICRTRLILRVREALALALGPPHSLDNLPDVRFEVLGTESGSEK